MLAQFNFQNFVPNEDVLKAANLTLFQSAEYLPYHETPMAVLKKVRNKYHCILKSRLLTGQNFSQEVTAKNAKAALLLLLEKIKSRLSLSADQALG